MLYLIICYKEFTGERKNFNINVIVFLNNLLYNCFVFHF